jgi:hypothetical protein
MKCIVFLLRILKERDLLRDLDIFGRIELKRISEKYGKIVWTGFSWPWIESCQDDNKYFDSLNDQEFYLLLKKEPASWGLQ